MNVSLILSCKMDFSSCDNLVSFSHIYDQMNKKYMHGEGFSKSGYSQWDDHEE